MTCRELERLLEGWLAETLPASERTACEEHLATCEACRDLVELAALADSAGALEASPPPDLVAGILERTSGATCARVREELVLLVDGELLGERRELVELHLGFCPDCRELRGVLEDLAGDLVLLAEVDPGPDFVESVLERTVRADRPRSLAGAEGVAGAGRDRAAQVTPARLRRWWKTTWPALVRRPRFAWEAAYVLALVLTPLVASADLPERAADLAGRAGRAGAVTVADVAQGFADRAGGVAEQAECLGESADAELRTFQKRVASSLERGRNDGPDDPDDPNPTKGDAP